VGTFEQLLTPPTAQHVGLLPYLVYFVLMLHLPFVGMLLVSSGLSVAYRKFNIDMARDFIRLVTPSTGGWIVFGLLPLVCLLFLLGQYMYGSSLPLVTYLERVFVLSLVAQALLFVYRKTLFLPAGVLGHFALVAAYFFFTSVMDLVALPERWPLTEGPLPFLFSIQVVVHFGIFSLFSILLTGSAILFFYFRWPDRKLPEDAAHRAAMRRWGLGLVLGGALLVPPHLLWDFFTAPAPVLSMAAFDVAAAAVLVLMAVCAMALLMLRESGARFSTHVFLLALAVFALVQFKAHSQQANANREHHLLVAQRAREARDHLRQVQEKLYAQAEPDPELGARVFTQRCSACHRWDEKLIGPAYMSVMPKYLGREEALRAFVGNPQRVDPSFPPMPNQGLRGTEVDSVARYLLQEARKRIGEGQP
jgi:cytochrome c